MRKDNNKLQKKLINATIDANVFVVPQVGSHIEDTEKYVETILVWSERLKSCPWLGMYKFELINDILKEDHNFPREQLKILFASHGIPEDEHEYDHNTVTSVVIGFLNRIQSFEDEFRVEIEDFTLDPFETNPEIKCFITFDDFQLYLLKRMIMTLAVLNKFCHEALGKHLLILREIPKKMNRILVRARIQNLDEHDRDDIVIRTPESFESSVLVCEDFKGLVEHLDESKALTDAADDDGIKLAIQIAMFKYNRRNNNITDWDSEELPYIGSKFRETCQQVCSREERGMPNMILRSIVYTIMQKQLKKTHWLKTGSGGNDPQKVRTSDKAKAWRREIGQRKKPFRLHYWHRIDNTIELASVNYHDDNSIPE